MCIIVSKPSDVLMPSYETLNTCWQGNSDGAGLSYVRPGDKSVTIIKGFMKFKELKDSLKLLDFKSEDAVMIHFRWATHGLKDAGNCHPFPVTNRFKDLRMTELRCPVAVSHNGVFGQMPEHETLSDTQKFIGKIMSDKAILNNLDSPVIRELLRGYCGTSSKLAIMSPTSVVHIGDFVVDKGVYYSNTGFRKWKTSTWTGSGYSIHSCDDATCIDDDPEFKCFLCQKEHGLEWSDDEECLLCQECMQYTSPSHRRILA